MRPLVMILATSIAAGAAMDIRGQATPCASMAAGALNCPPPPLAQSSGTDGAAEITQPGSETSGDSLVPPQPSPQQVADSAVGHAMAANPQKAGEDQIDYTIRVTRIAQGTVAQRSPQAATILRNRLVELEDMKQRLKPQ